MKSYSNNLKRYYKNKIVKTLNIEIDEELLELMYMYLETEMKDNIIKTTKRRKIYRLELNDKTYYLKKFLKNSIKMSSNILTTPGDRSFEMAKQLNENGIKALEYFALIEDRTCFKLKAKSMIISKELKTDNLMEVYSENNDKNNLLDKFSEFYLKILKENLYHKDPTFWNFGILNEELTVIDIDSIRKFYFPKLFMRQKYINSISFLNFTLVKTINREMKNILTYSDRDYIILKLLKDLNFGKDELRKINSKTRKKSKDWLKKRNILVPSELDIEEGKINE